jgi:citrate synthase
MRMEKVLFQITEENLDTGLRGFPVGYCTTSTVDPTKGLFYRKIPITDLYSWEPEEVIYLLIHGSRGNKQEIGVFTKDLRVRATLHPEFLEQIRKLPRICSPMKLLSAALLLANAFEGTSNYREDGLNLIAKIPAIVAAVINHHAGWGVSRPARPELGYMENFIEMVNIPSMRNKKELATIFKLFNILHYDHGGGNLSTFVGKAVASGLEDLYGSLSAAMSALAGPRHGRANQDCLEFTQSLLDQLGENATEGQIETAIRERLQNQQLVFGFGHAVLRTEDPRASIFYTAALERYSSHPLVKIAILLREAGSKVLKENSKISCPYANVDAISGVVLTAAGFPYPEYYTLLFGLSRVIGIAIQIVYERCEARKGKGTPIVRPKYLFKDSV